MNPTTNPKSSSSVIDHTHLPESNNLHKANYDPPLGKPLIIDHTHLPETDGKPVDNYYQPIQSSLLTQAIEPVLPSIQPDGQFSIGKDSGIYFRLTEPFLEGCRAPDWFLVLGVPPNLPDALYRRSYVLWRECLAPLLTIEYVSGDGSEEHDQTPRTGKFWIYEKAIHTAFYCIYNPQTATIELYGRKEDKLVMLAPNALGNWEIPPLGLQLGTWTGTLEGFTLTWLRFYDREGRLLPTPDERAEDEREGREEAERRTKLERDRADNERQRADNEHRRADNEHRRAEQLAQKLRKLGLDPDSL